MDRNDQQAIEELFRKLGDVERQGTPPDEEADSLIRQQIAAQPAAPYYMAQTIVVQEQALNAAQARIEALERDNAAPAGGGLFGGLFGGGQRGGRGSVPSVPRQPAAGYPGARGYAQPGRGGGFLAGAAQTAMGVAGGVLIGSAIAGMFDGGEAAAAQEDMAAGDSGGDLGGDDFGDMDF